MKNDETTRYYESSFAAHMADFIRYKRAQGLNYDAVPRSLRSFSRFLSANGDAGSSSAGYSGGQVRGRRDPTARTRSPGIGTILVWGQGRSRDRWPDVCSGGSAVRTFCRVSGMARLGGRTYLFPHRIRESVVCLAP